MNMYIKCSKCCLQRLSHRLKTAHMESFGFLSDWVVVWTFLERKSTSYTRSKNRSYCFELLWFYLEIRMVKTNGTSENKSSAVPLEGVHSHPDSLTASFSVERKKERKKENTSDISIARRLQHSQPPRLHRPIVSHTNTASVSTCLLPLSRVTLIMVAIRKPIQWMALTVSWALTQSQTPVTTHHVMWITGTFCAVLQINPSRQYSLIKAYENKWDNEKVRNKSTLPQKNQAVCVVYFLCSLYSLEYQPSGWNKSVHINFHHIYYEL